MDVGERQVVVDDKPVLVEFSKARRSALSPIGGIEAGLRCAPLPLARVNGNGLLIPVLGLPLFFLSK